MKEIRGFLFAVCVVVFPLRQACAVTAPDAKAVAEAVKQVQDIDKDHVWDFGPVKAGVVLKHTFSLKNDTGKVLRIRSVNSSCGCTTSEVKKKELQPKETTDIEVSFNSKGYAGMIHQYVFVTTDNAANPIIRFMITADVQKQK